MGELHKSVTYGYVRPEKSVNTLRRYTAKKRVFITKYCIDLVTTQFDGNICLKRHDFFGYLSYHGL